MTIFSLITAFIFGLLAFFTPCSLPLVPSFVAFLTGQSINELKDKAYTKTNRNSLVIHTLLYTSGSSLMLVLLGSIVGGLGYFLHAYRIYILEFGGLLVIIFGIFILKQKGAYLRFPFVNKLITALTLENKDEKHYVLSFLLGALFTLSWAPCISPFLGSILILATSSGSIIKGILLLFVYAIGLNIPFMLIGIFFANFAGYFDIFKAKLHFFTRVSGAAIILAGSIMTLLGILQIVGNFYSKLPI